MNSFKDFFSIHKRKVGQELCCVRRMPTLKQQSPYFAKFAKGTKFTNNFKTMQTLDQCIGHSMNNIKALQNQASKRISFTFIVGFLFVKHP
jgi:hypothetical protein